MLAMAKKYHFVTGGFYEPRDDITVRPGRPSDLPAIERLTEAGNIWEGRDYLPGLWIEYLRNPNIIVIVAEKHGEILAVNAVTLTAGSSLCSGWAGRSHPHHRQTGAFKESMNELRKRINSSNFSISRVSGLTQYIDFFDKNKTMERSLFYFLNQVPLFHNQPLVDVKRALIHAQLSKQMLDLSLKSVSQVDKNQMRVLLRNSSQMKRIVPGEVINLAYESIEAVEENVQHFCSYRTLPFAGKSTNGETTSLSFGNTYQCPIGLRYDIAYYSQDGDIMTAASHILHHLEALVKRHFCYGGNIACQIIFPEGLLGLKDLQSFLQQNFGICDGESRMKRKMTQQLFFPKAKL